MSNDYDTETPSKGEHRRMPSDEISRWPPDEISIAKENRIDDHWSNYSQEDEVISVKGNRIADPWSDYTEDYEISVEENRITDPWSNYMQEGDISRGTQRITAPWANYTQEKLAIVGYPSERGRKGNGGGRRGKAGGSRYETSTMASSSADWTEKSFEEWSSGGFIEGNDDNWKKNFEDNFEDDRRICCFCLPRPKRRSTTYTLILLSLVVVFWVTFGVLQSHHRETMNRDITDSDRNSCEKQRIEDNEKVILELSMVGLPLTDAINKEDDTRVDRIMQVIEDAVIQGYNIESGGGCNDMCNRWMYFARVVTHWDEDTTTSALLRNESDNIFNGGSASGITTVILETLISEKDCPVGEEFASIFPDEFQVAGGGRKLKGTDKIVRSKQIRKLAFPSSLRRGELARNGHGIRIGKINDRISNAVDYELIVGLDGSREHQVRRKLNGDGDDGVVDFAKVAVNVESILFQESKNGNILLGKKFGGLVEVSIKQKSVGTRSYAITDEMRRRSGGKGGF